MNSDLWQVPVPVEQGLYEAVFKGVEDFEIKEGAFPGVKWRWKFEICSGTHRFWNWNFEITGGHRPRCKIIGAKPLRNR